MIKQILKTIFLSLLLFSIFFVSPCYADEQARAKAMYFEGIELFSKEKYPEALAVFKESYKLNPKPVVLFNMAMCHQALFHYVEAIEMFNRFHKEGGNSIKPKRLKETQLALEKLAPLVGNLKLQDAPDDAKLYVDGVAVRITPLKQPVLLNPGQHIVRVSMDGYQPMETHITVASGAEMAVRAALTKLERRSSEEIEPVAIVPIPGGLAGIF